MVAETSGVEAPEFPPDTIFQAHGGWWHKPIGSYDRNQGPFLTYELARKSYITAAPRRMAIRVTDQEAIAEVCKMLRVPCPEFRQLKSITFTLKAEEPIEIITTYYAVE